VTVVLLLASTGCPLHHETPGEKIYNEYCADCHGMDGAGNTAQGMGNPYTDLLDNTWKFGGDDRSISNVIRDGSFGAMPAFHSKLTDEQIEAVLHHIRTLRGERPPELAR
jgi:cytochrome c oxidase cbb3-type subunit 3